MGIFATLTRKLPADGPESGWELSERVRVGLPARFEAVGEALASGSSPLAACEVAGRSLAQDGASLDEVLDGLRTTTLRVTGHEPAFATVRAISVAWSEATLTYLHQLSCEDPLTGLASPAHVRSRLSELYRGQVVDPGVQETHALVVAELPLESGAPTEGTTLARTMRLVHLGEAARTVFSGDEVIGSLGASRIAVIAERDDHLGRRVALLRKLLGLVDYPTRVWIEGLPTGDAGAAHLLDDLSRTWQSLT